VRGYVVGVWMAVVVSALAAAGCASWYRADADREVSRLLETYGRSHPRPPVSMEDVGDTPARAADLLERRLPEPPSWVADTSPATPRVLDLAAAEAVAVTCNREYLSRRETLFLTALALTGERHRFRFRPDVTFDARSVGGAAIDETIAHTTLIQISKILLYGGTVTVSGQQDATHTIAHHDDPDAWSAGAAVELTQPLLRGFGREVSRDPLIQARRDLIYDLRAFVQYRQDFAIDVARAYWNLQRLRERVRNQERSLQRMKQLKARADARFDKGAAQAVDRFRAASEVLRAQADVTDDRRAFALALDELKVRLGLPVEAAIDVAEDRPAFEELHPDLVRAARAALRNRVDLQNAADRADDAARRVRVARNALLASLDVSLRYETRTDAGEGLDSQRWGDGETTVGLSLSLPVDRTFERNAYREALVTVDRARRDQSLARDQVILDVRERIRELRVAEMTVALQRETIKQLEREREMANIRVERGEASNRDVVDAENRLLEAQNRLVAAEVDHATARLRFRRSIGTLEIDEKGMWRE